MGANENFNVGVVLADDDHADIVELFSDESDGGEAVGLNAYVATSNNGEKWVLVDEEFCIRATTKALSKYAKSGTVYFTTGNIKDNPNDHRLYFKASVIENPETGDEFVTQILFNNPSDCDVCEMVIALIWELTPERDADSETITFAGYVKSLFRARDDEKYLSDVKTGAVLKFDSKGSEFVGFLAESQQGSIHFHIKTAAYYLEHGMSIKLGRDCIVPLIGKYYVNELPFVPATDEQVKERIAKAKVTVHESPWHAAYKGMGLTPSFFGPVSHHLDTRVMIDAYGLHLTNNNDLENILAIGGYVMKSTLQQMDKETRNALKDEDFAIMIPSGPMYDLKTKTWFYGDIQNVSPIEFRKTAFEKIRMEESKKQLIRRLCESNGSSTRSVDLIDGKGGGHIFLLHGDPGTGKTLTAESVSELQEKPLYKLSLGEFGNISSLEQGLEKALALAERWNAVMLIDEADVALEKRTSNDIARNALVAVFLRLLEYYQGIMFLTSNRAEEFDPAFKSRITFALHFQRPDNAGRAYIWKMLLENAEAKIEDFDIDHLATYDLDGRQIKNIINTSASLAGDGDLSVLDVQTLINQTVEFSDFITANLEKL